MVVLHQTYQISEKPTIRMTVIYKVLHILLFAVAAVSGFITAFAFGEALDDFDYNCVLSPNIQFLNGTYIHVPGDVENTTQLREIDRSLSLWGAEATCNFAQFTPLASTVSSIIWGTFFIIVAKGGEGYASDILQIPWKIVYPCIFFSFTFSLVFLSSTIILGNGIEAFCNQFRDEFHTPKCVRDINLYTLQFHEFEQDFYSSCLVAKTFSYIGLGAWVSQLVVLILRIVYVADFDLQIVTISEKEEERVEQIIDFHDEDDETLISQV